MNGGGATTSVPLDDAKNETKSMRSLGRAGPKLSLLGARARCAAVRAAMARRHQAEV